jgi:hypothetical protein
MRRRPTVRGKGRPSAWSTHAALFGCSRPSSVSGAALSSTDPAGSCTGSVPIATATKKSALFADQHVAGLHAPGAAVVRAEDLRLPQQPAQLQSLGHQRQRGLRVLLLAFERLRAAALGLRQPRHWCLTRDPSFSQQETVAQRVVRASVQPFRGARAVE